MNTKKLGGLGEKIAKDFLVNKGFKILETNYATKLGEIDIIAKDKNGVLVFIEVKTRITEKFGLPREAVTVAKQRKIRLVAQEYLQKTDGFNKPARFDVIEILDGEINAIENAFWLTSPLFLFNLIYNCNLIKQWFC